MAYIISNNRYFILFYIIDILIIIILYNRYFILFLIIDILYYNATFLIITTNNLIA